MKLLVSLLILVVSQYIVNSKQPYFPEQVVFSTDKDNKTVIAIDEVNQRAYLKMNITSDDTDIAYVMQHIPYAKSGSPQAKHYVQLILSHGKTDICSYLTYWEYTYNPYGLFPQHWGNDSSYHIKNYVNFSYPMIHSINASVNEDYWYSNKTCQVDSGEVYPCQEIYFKKNTDIPIRYTEVVLVDSEIIRRFESYTIYSTEKPSDAYFESIPKDWSDSCRDGNLEVLYNPDQVAINMKESAKVEVWLPAPPHKIDGNDNVVLRWQSFLCRDCFEWTPSHLVFNGTNFRKKQILTITRVKDSEETVLFPLCTGGGYDDIPCYAMYLTID